MTSHERLGEVLQAIRKLYAAGHEGGDSAALLTLGRTRAALDEAMRKTKERMESFVPHNDVVASINRLRSALLECVAHHTNDSQRDGACAAIPEEPPLPKTAELLLHEQELQWCRESFDRAVEQEDAGAACRVANLLIRAERAYENQLIDDDFLVEAERATEIAQAWEDRGTAFLKTLDNETRNAVVDDLLRREGYANA